MNCEIGSVIYVGAYLNPPWVLPCFFDHPYDTDTWRDCEPGVQARFFHLIMTALQLRYVLIPYQNRSELTDGASKGEINMSVNLMSRAGENLTYIRPVGNLKIGIVGGIPSANFRAPWLFLSILPEYLLSMETVLMIFVLVLIRLSKEQPVNKKTTLEIWWQLTRSTLNQSSSFCPKKSSTKIGLITFVMYCMFVNWSYTALSMKAYLPQSTKLDYKSVDEAIELIYRKKLTMIVNDKQPCRTWLIR